MREEVGQAARYEGWLLSNVCVYICTVMICFLTWAQVQEPSEQCENSPAHWFGSIAASPLGPAAARSIRADTAISATKQGMQMAAIAARCSSIAFEARYERIAARSIAAAAHTPTHPHRDGAWRRGLAWWPRWVRMSTRRGRGAVVRAGGRPPGVGYVGGACTCSHGTHAQGINS